MSVTMRKEEITEAGFQMLQSQSYRLSGTGQRASVGSMVQKG